MPQMTAPANGVNVRMYRLGHGDCFLLAFPRKTGRKPVYVLIDCGYKPGSNSEDYFTPGRTISEIVDDLFEATGGEIDLAIVTHEHQDHCNGIWKEIDPYFDRFTIREAWFAWTESPADPLAKELRKRHRDTLLGLLEARLQLTLAAGPDNAAVQRLNSLMSLELGGEDLDAVTANRGFGASSPENSVNKQAMKLIRDKALAENGVRYFDPGKAPVDVPRTKGVKAYFLGPPKRADLLGDEDPVGDEGFPSGRTFSFRAAIESSEGDEGLPPFRAEFCVSKAQALSQSSPDGEFFIEHYGTELSPVEDADKTETRNDAAWRRIDEEWLYAAESLALKLNAGINNTSLVVAFELPESGKVLLFAADAQRGNWISWNTCKWDDGETGRVQDLLSRTVLYKVGHHGSHNATLNGSESSAYANLSWMGTQFPNEFTAMITAVNKWALQVKPKPWRHPLPSIRRALEEKAQGRVFQTDQDSIDQPESVSNSAWKRFTSRATFESLFFEYTIEDKA